MHLRFRIRLLLCAGLLVASSKPVWAEEPRYTTIFSESIEDKARATSTAESAFVEAMMGQGGRFVDESQARQIRALATADQVLEGKIPSGLTSFDADVLIAARCEMSPIKQGIYPEGVHRYSADIEARAISIDSGAVIAAISTSASALGYSKKQAAVRAARAVAQKLAKTLMQKVESSQESSDLTLELHVQGLPGILATENIAKGLERIEGTKKVRVLHAGRKLSRFELKTTLPKSREFAFRLDSAANLGLVVYGYSNRVVRAEYSPARKASLHLIPTIFEGRTAKQGWRFKAISMMIATELSNIEFLQQQARLKALKLPRAQKDWSSALSRAEVKAERALVLKGRVQQRKKLLQVSAELAVATTGVVAAAAQTSCPAETPSACAQALGTLLTTRLSKRFESRRDLFPGAPRRAGPLTAARPLNIKEVKILPIFPATALLAETRSLGNITVRNVSDLPLTDVQLEVSIPGFVKKPLTTSIGKIDAKSDHTIPVKAALDLEKLRQHDTPQNAVITARLTYTAGEQSGHETRNSAVLIHDRNTINWKTTESAAAFVTPRAVSILQSARTWRGLLPKVLQDHRIALPVALFNALGALSLSYTPDPASPFGSEPLDYVQYPVQTLTRGTGDCDDLSILYAALAESVGMPALLLATPGHIFTAISTGLPPQASHLMGASTDQLLIHGGMLWIPVETTLVGRSFSEAWEAGAREVSRWKDQKGKLQVVDLRSAWKRFPPTDLSRKDELHIKEISGNLAERVQSEVHALELRRQRELNRAIRAVDEKLSTRTSTKLLNKKAALLAHSGQKEEAQTILQNLVAQNDPVANNNAGNLALHDGEIKEALGHYHRAIAKTNPKAAVPMRLNAALAAFTLGKEEEFASQIMACLDAGADDAVLSLTQAGWGSGEGRASSAQQIELFSLREKLRGLFSKRKQQIPAPLQDLEKTRAAQSNPKSVMNYLFWLTP